MKAEGRVFKFGDNVNTDVIIPARYLNTSDPKELAAHCMEDLDGAFAGGVRAGDILVAGQNFGCGSSREHAPIAIKACGVSCVVAASYARIFYRNAINIGLAILECPEACRRADAGDVIRADFGTGVVENLTKNERYQAGAFPPFIRHIIESGGLMNALKGGRDI